MFFCKNPLIFSVFHGTVQNWCNCNWNKNGDTTVLPRGFDSIVLLQNCVNYVVSTELLHCYNTEPSKLNQYLSIYFQQGRKVEWEKETCVLICTKIYLPYETVQNGVQLLIKQTYLVLKLNLTQSRDSFFSFARCVCTVWCDD